MAFNEYVLLFFLIQDYAEKTAKLTKKRRQCEVWGKWLLLFYGTLSPVLIPDFVDLSNF